MNIFCKALVERPSKNGASFNHAYANISYADTTNKDYPDSVEENCVTAKNSNGKEKQYCSRKQTPLIRIQINIDDSNPQEDIDDEVEKSITLEKDKDTDQDSSQDTEQNTNETEE